MNYGVTGNKIQHVIVDGITGKAGKKVVVIRDPHGKSYFSPLETFKKAFTGEARIPRNFK